MKQELLLQLIKNALRFQWFFSRQFNRIEEFLSGFTLAALKPEYRSLLTAAIYSARGSYQTEGLFDWEKTWFEEDLPQAPARVLVGGAGTGREVRHLVELGLEVVAFDPADSFVTDANKSLSNQLCLGFYRGSYEDLVDSGTETNRDIAEMIESHAPYQAILLGWGSFTHVSSEEIRRKLLTRLQRLCPLGPLMLSFWMRGEDAELKRSRLWKLGWKSGQCVEASNSEDNPDLLGDSLQGRAGFGHHFTLGELRSLASATNYEISRSPIGAYSGSFPHATMQAVKQQ